MNSFEIRTRSKDLGLENPLGLDRQLEIIESPVSITLSNGHRALEVPMISSLGIPAEIEKVYTNDFEDDAKMLISVLNKLKISILLKLGSGSLVDLNKINSQNLKSVQVANKEFEISNLNSLAQDLTPEEAEELREEYWESSFFHPKPDDFTRAKLLGFKDRLDNLVQKIFQILNQSKLFSDPAGESLLVAYKDEYRNLLRAISLILVEKYWNSPTYYSSKGGQKGPGQESKPFQTDYQRYRYQELQLFERNGLFKYSGFPANFTRIYPVLFNNALSAFGIMAETLKKVARPNNRLKIVSTPVYFEVDELLANRLSGSEITNLDRPTEEELLKEIKTNLPDAVFLAPVTNNIEMRVLDIHKILTGLCDPEWIKAVSHEIEGKIMTLIIDDTMAERNGHWKTFRFQKLPPFIQIWSAESLIKYAQQGQEFAQAGMVVCIGDYSDSDLIQQRSEQGAVPEHEKVQRLKMVLNPEASDQRFIRHSRNAKLAVQHISYRKANETYSFIKALNYPKNSEAQVIGGVFTIDVDVSDLAKKTDFRFTSEALVINFCRIAVELARRAGLDLNMGTSFGFDVTRIAGYKKPPSFQTSDFDTHYIRVAMGTENAASAFLISECLARANDIFSEAIRQGRLADLYYIDKIL